MDRLAFPVSPFFEISALADDSDFNHFCENVFEWLVSEAKYQVERYYARRQTAAQPSAGRRMRL